MGKSIAHAGVDGSVAFAHQRKAIPQKQNAAIVLFDHGVGQFFLKRQPDDITRLGHVDVFWVVINKFRSLAHSFSVTLAPIEPHGFLEASSNRFGRGARGGGKISINLLQVVARRARKNLGHAFVVDGRVIDAAFDNPQTGHFCRLGSRIMSGKVVVQKVCGKLVAKAGVHIAHFEEQLVVALLPRQQVKIQPVQGHGFHGLVQGLIVASLQKEKRRVFNVIAGPALANKVKYYLRVSVLFLLVQRPGKTNRSLLQKRRFGILVEHH